jgi:hypothetical protein
LEVNFGASSLAMQIAFSLSVVFPEGTNVEKETSYQLQLNRFSAGKVFSFNSQLARH